MASYPTTIWSDGNNTNGTTVVNATYMNARDNEIIAIETALGINIVTSGATVALSARVQVNNSNNLILAGTAGNVGIGTTDPQGKLHVAGGGTANIRQDNNDWLSWKDTYGAYRHIMSLDNSSNVVIRNPTIGDTILDSAKVGVGRTGPATCLHVNGPITLDNAADPASPAAERAVLYTRKNAGNKMELVVRFPTGTKVVATED